MKPHTLKIEIELNLNTGELRWLHDWLLERTLKGEALNAWNSLHNRYHAIQDDQSRRILEHREQEYSHTAKLMRDSDPKMEATQLLFPKEVHG